MNKPERYERGKNPEFLAAQKKPGGPGRPKGSKGKIEKRVKADIFETYLELGGKDYLAVVATEDPKTFCGMLTKLIPNVIQAEIGRPGDFDHLTDEELDEAIFVKFREQYRDRLHEIGRPLSGEGAETIVSGPDSVHQEDQTGVQGGATPSPDGGKASSG